MSRALTVRMAAEFLSARGWEDERAWISALQAYYTARRGQLGRGQGAASRLADEFVCEAEEAWWESLPRVACATCAKAWVVCDPVWLVPDAGGGQAIGVKHGRCGCGHPARSITIPATPTVLEPEQMRLL